MLEHWPACTAQAVPSPDPPLEHAGAISETQAKTTNKQLNRFIGPPNFALNRIPCTLSKEMETVCPVAIQFSF
jgi:hypothetical protein